MKYILAFSFFIASFFSMAQNDSTAFNRPDIPGDLVVDVGFNFWTQRTTHFKPSVWPSKSVGVYYMTRKALSKKFSFYFGLGLGLEKYSLGDTLTLKTVNKGVAIDTLPILKKDDLRKNKLAVNYVEIPLELRFHPSGTVTGEGFFIGIGGLLGYRFSSHTKIKYDDAGGDVITQKIKGDYGLNDFRYGAMFKFGFKGVSLYYKHFFNTLFEQPLEGKQPTSFSVGVSLMGF